MRAYMRGKMGVIIWRLQRCAFDVPNHAVFCMAKEGAFSNLFPVAADPPNAAAIVDLECSQQVSLINKGCFFVAAMLMIIFRSLF